MMHCCMSIVIEQGIKVKIFRKDHDKKPFEIGGDCDMM
jgi:hypothetical protein